MSRFTGEYTDDWAEVAQRVKDEAGWCCVRCGHPHDPASGHMLTVHHLDMNPAHSDPEAYWWNLAALCQKCHLQIQTKVNLNQMWPLEHTPWFRPYAAGWYAYKYLGLVLTREQVEARLDELLSLERMI